MAPTTYLLHGDDEYAIKTFISAMQSKMGDSSVAEMNTSTIGWRGFSLGAVKNAAYAMPFLTARRLVILDGVIENIKRKADQEKFLDLLEGLPQSTALVLVTYKLLSEKNWAVKWAVANKSLAFVKRFEIPKGAAMAAWIRDYAKSQGGEITPQASGLLASVATEDPRMAAQEVDKLLAYANYQRAIEPEDVDELTTTVQQGDVFKMVDAIGGRNGRVALNMLHQLLKDRDALSLFGMIIRQFRLLLQVSELLEEGATQNEIAKTLNLHPFVAGKIVKQARNFSMQSLETIYRQLLNVDENIKTGKQDATVALDTLIAALTG